MTPLIPRLGTLLAGLAFAAGGSAQNISIATGGTGGVYYPMGGGLANILTKHVPGIQATAEVTGGSVDNLKLVGAGQADIGFSHDRRRPRCAERRGQVQASSCR